MKRLLLLGIAVLAALPMSSSHPGARADAAGAAEMTLVFGGVIHTGFEARPASDEGAVSFGTVEAMLVEGHRIAAMGPLATLSESAKGRRAKRLDLRGGHAFPGFQDAHGHVEQFGASLEEVDLVGCATYAELVRRVQERAKELPAGQWILGRGWDQTRWPGAEFPHHRELSAAVPDHPVLVTRVDGHAALANRAALERAGLWATELPADPAGGAILREDGQATGVLVDTAMGFVHMVVPEESRAVRRRRILRAQAGLVATGLTCVHDMGVDREATAIFRELERAGELKLRIVSYVRGNGFDDAKDFEGFDTEVDPRDVFGVAGIKFMLDGALGSRGAALIEDYSDDAGNKGLSRFDAARFARQVRLAGAAGLQPATHAIGDRANRDALDAYARAGREQRGFKALRPRIEHAQVVAASDFKRFGELGVIPSMQPTHATSDMRWVRDRLGEDRTRGAYAWKTLARSTPLPLAFGSDFPVERPEPLEGFYAALTRQDRDGDPEGGFLPKERLSAAEALAAFTSGAAVAARQEDRRGRLAVGYACDLTVVDTDLSRLDGGRADAALSSRVLMTIINGEVVYRADQK